MSDWSSYEKKISSAASPAELDALDHALFGRKEGRITQALTALKNLPATEKKEAAKELNIWKKKLTELLSQRLKEIGSASCDEAMDVTLELPKKERGHLHPIPEFIRSVEEVFGRMGFEVATGPEIESEDMNFNALNVPADHPARDTQDTFWINNVKNTVLRTQTSPVQIRYMQNHPPPFRMICPGKVYRKDADATHSPMFHQFEGLMIGKDVSLANMKAVMIQAVRELIDPDATFRFRTGYFPFVEPGLEIDMRWRGDPQESREGSWLEIAGCGMVHQNVLRNVDIDPKQWQGFAFGFGVERMIMLKERIPDLRLFYEGDLRFLRQF